MEENLLLIRKESDFWKIQKMADSPKIREYIRAICLFRMSFLNKDPHVCAEEIYRMEDSALNVEVLNLFEEAKRILIKMEKEELKRVLQSLNKK